MNAVVHSEKLVADLLALADEHPGQAVTITRQPGGVEIGVLNFSPLEDDWFFTPVPIEQIEQRGIAGILLTEIS